MKNATVKWFNTQRGYGFITDLDSKEDVFVHHSNIVMDGFRYLNEEDIVNYDKDAGKDGRDQAVNVQPILTMKMVEDSLKEEKLYVKVIKVHKATKYQVVDANDMLQAGENGMTFLELAAFSGYDTEGLSA